MSAISQTEDLSPFSQIRQFFSSIGSLLSSLCERTDSAFCRVHVKQKDENGNIKFYEVKNDNTGETKRTDVLSYVESIKTGELQLDEPKWLIATKCALITLGMPFYAVGKIAWQMFKTPIEISALAIQTLIKAGKQFALGSLYEGTVEMWRGVSQVPEMFGNGLFEIIKAPIFFLGAELAAIYGIFRPYHGRKIEAIIEHAWLKGASYKNDIRNVPKRPNENCWDAFVKDVRDTHPFYFAQCFQVRGNVNDARIVVVKREAL